MSFLDLRTGSLVQDSDEWHDWRKKHIGASDVPALMKTCDFRTPEDIFKSKVFGEKFEGNYATQRGKILEPLILAKAEAHFGCLLNPQTVEYPEWPRLSASLDGLNWKQKILVEAKAPSRAKHQMALYGEVPETYRDQVQAQMLVVGVDRAFYVSYTDTEPEGFDLAIVEVKADAGRQLQILETCQRFWRIVENGVWSEDF